MKKFLIIMIMISVGVLVSSTFAQNSCQRDTSTNNQYSRATGLISAPFISGRFSNPAGQCVADSKAAFAPYKIPSFDDLKSLYYDQSKVQKSVITSLPSSFSADGLYYVNGDLTVSSSPSISGAWSDCLNSSGQIAVCAPGGTQTRTCSSGTNCTTSQACHTNTLCPPTCSVSSASATSDTSGTASISRAGFDRINWF